MFEILYFCNIMCGINEKQNISCKVIEVVSLDNSEPLRKVTLAAAHFNIQKLKIQSCQKFKTHGDYFGDFGAINVFENEKY